MKEIGTHHKLSTETDDWQALPQTDRPSRCPFQKSMKSDKQMLLTVKQRRKTVCDNA